MNKLRDLAESIEHLKAASASIQDAWKAARRAGHLDMAESLVTELARLNVIGANLERSRSSAERAARRPADWYLVN